MIRKVLLVALMAAFLPHFVASAQNARGCVVKDSVLTVGKGVTRIPEYAYKDRDDIREIRFEEGPSSLREIGEYAFLGCASLKRVELPAGAKKLGTGCFRECVSLKELDIPAGTVTLPSEAFYGCTSLERVSLPASLQTIGSRAFIYCDALKEISFPERLKNIGSNAFSFCKRLEEVMIPRTVTELESYAFSSCSSLKKAMLPSNGSLLGELIFSGCEALTEIVEASPVVPKFDCASFLFDPDDEAAYRRVVLMVSPGKVAAYRSAPGWRLFQNIESILVR